MLEKESEKKTESYVAADRLGIDVDQASIPGALIFRLEGRLDIFTYLELKRRMEPYLAGCAGQCWLMDLTGVSFVASSGWSVFLAMRARLKREDCRLALVGLAPNLDRIHQSMSMGKLVPSFPTLADARARLGL